RLSPTRWLGLHWTTNQTFGTNAGDQWLNNINGKQPEGYEKRYDELLNYLAIPQAYSANTGILIRGTKRLATAAAPAAEMDAAAVEESVVVGYGEQKEMAQDSAAPQEPSIAPGETVPIRTNLQETAFF